MISMDIRTAPAEYFIPFLPFQTKLAILEEKLQKETCQRLLVQEKAERVGL